MFRLFFLTLLCVGSLHSQEEPQHQFIGKHFLASYLDCDPEAIRNVDQLIDSMDAAVRASNATILEKTSHIFSPNGLTIVYLLSESHASLHTYPEYNACFVDIFTCGDHCSSAEFDQKLRAYLKPQTVSARFLLRNETIQEGKYVEE